MRLDPNDVRDYFVRPGTVSEWWMPDTGPLSFHYDAEVTVLEDHLPLEPSWRVLDVGTGRGRFGAYCARRGCRVVGIDLSAEMLDAARETAERAGVAERFDLRQGGAENLSSFGEGEFDAVLCMELFDHLPDLHRALAQMRRVLKPGGRFVFTYVPSESIYGALGNVYRRLNARLRPSNGMISRSYSFGAVRSALTDSGLELERYWGIGLLCLNAQTRLFSDNIVTRSLTALARAEARRWPYYERPSLARHGAHVVGLARPVRR